MKIFTSKEYLPYFMATLIGVMFGILILTFSNKNNISTDDEIISKNLIGNSFNKAVNKASPSVVNIYSDVLVNDRRSQFPFSDRFNSILGVIKREYNQA